VFCIFDKSETDEEPSYPRTQVQTQNPEKTNGSRAASAQCRHNRPTVAEVVESRSERFPSVVIDDREKSRSRRARWGEEKWHPQTGELGGAAVLL
jgi:hypothetical protein